jgi:hypothetical protein
MRLVPVVRPNGRPVRLSRSVSPLVRAAVREFCSRWTPGGVLVHVEDGSGERTNFDETMILELGTSVETKGRLPDLVVYVKEKDWLVLIEAATGNGPINSKRHEDLKSMFRNSKAGLMLVTAFPNREAMAKHSDDISWETEVWVADSPEHLVHFDGGKIHGPYAVT